MAEQRATIGRPFIDGNSFTEDYEFQKRCRRADGIDVVISNNDAEIRAIVQNFVVIELKRLPAFTHNDVVIRTDCYVGLTGAI